MLTTKKSGAFTVAFALSVALLCLGNVVSAVETPTHQQMERKAASGATLTATLVDAEMNAKEQTATVKVAIGGAKLIDPAMTNKKPTKGQGHLHYQVDDGPVIATTTTKLSFHGLKPGKHQIVVMLANNDHSPAGPQQTLEITIP